jgi:pyruvate kinase
MNGPLHRTKIIATIGPATESLEGIRSLIEAGMNIARLNFSHGAREQHAEVVRRIRTLAAELGRTVSILQDLQGPKLRVGQVPGGVMELVNGTEVTLRYADGDVGAGVIPVDFANLADDAEPGAPVLLDDGLLELVVTEVDGRDVRCRVVQGGPLKSRKGVLFPTLELSIPAVTAKDLADLETGIALGVDFVALSFVRHADDVRQLRREITRLGADTPIIAKIEKPQAVERIDEILPEVDGIMVARGDLGIEMRAEQLPHVQKRLIKLCNDAAIPVITATQMLESMIVNPRPTRAEVSDVANAILDGTDAVMLSGESAVGKFPARAVATMARIAAEIETGTNVHTHPKISDDIAQVVGQALEVIDYTIELKAIVTFTTSGQSARWVSSVRPRAAFYAVTESSTVCQRVNLYWGVKPLLVESIPPSLEGGIAMAEQLLINDGLAARGDTILITGGLPMGVSGSTNYLKIHKL